MFIILWIWGIFVTVDKIIFGRKKSLFGQVFGQFGQEKSLGQLITTFLQDFLPFFVLSTRKMGVYCLDKVFVLGVLRRFYGIF